MLPAHVRLSTPRTSTQLESKRHVVDDIHVRVRSVVLEDHRDSSILVRHEASSQQTNLDLFLGGVLQTGDQSQRRGFLHLETPQGRMVDSLSSTAIEISSSAAKFPDYFVVVARITLAFALC